MMSCRTMRSAVMTLTSMILRRRLKRYLGPLGPFALAIDGNAVVAAERADPRLGPAVAAPGRLAGAIEEPRDLLVGHQARQLTDQQQGIFGHRPAMLAGPVDLQIQRGVVPTLPMQDYLDEAPFDAHNDLVQCRAQDPLACRCGRSRVRPGELEIGAKPQKAPPLLPAEGPRLLRLKCGELDFDPVPHLQRLVPPALQLASDQTIGGIDSIILPTGMRRREARLLQPHIALPLGG